MILKTVLGDEIICNKEIELLLRYPKHKKYEADLLLKLPIGYSFLDIGGHYGDTVFTMAIHAKNNNRSDIRFYVFEPDTYKCKMMKENVLLNDLNIVVYQYGVGDTTCRIGNLDKKGRCSATYKKYPKGKLSMIKLDDLKDILEPIGFMHIDVEGWESRVLEGANQILQNKENKIYIIAECWPNNESYERGFSLTPRLDILNIMNKYTHYIQQDDLIDELTNLVFYPLL